MNKTCIIAKTFEKALIYTINIWYNIKNIHFYYFTILGGFMNGDTLQILIAMVIYMAIVIMIGAFYAKRANKSSEEYYTIKKHLCKPNFVISHGIF